MENIRKFSGQPVISQVLKFLNLSKINRTARNRNSDKYYKKFKTYDHLVVMIYAVISGVNSLREITSIMLACEGKINHLGIKHFPRRSTISDANKKRSSEVFGEIYNSLYRDYKGFLSDSNPSIPAVKGLKIIDSTTISLFSDILKGAGRNPLNGKKKGGIKMHTMINSLEDVPSLVKFSSASTHDQTFLRSLGLKKGSFIVFDKGYTDYNQYLQWSLEDIYFVTRQKDNAVYESLEEFDVGDEIDPGVLRDEKIEIKKDGKAIELRRVAYWYEPHKRVYEFISNNFEISAEKVAQIYKNRWQIENMFKRLKQNFPLKYFLGDNQNAIEIQIWVSLIIQLIMLVLQRKIKRSWAYSNMVSIVRFHLMTYIDLFMFLENPESDWVVLSTKIDDQLLLFE